MIKPRATLQESMGEPWLSVLFGRVFHPGMSHGGSRTGAGWIQGERGEEHEEKEMGTLACSMVGMCWILHVVHIHLARNRPDEAKVTACTDGHSLH